ncbi:MAG: protein-L-isoaspartate(D-aspartate) O-methyltransferase [Kiritimatiellota bacterium]|nr:protein-L-isoaspartate(D-aspartate) O-methyltransferase [Kiritimatiellota bacterium]
MVRTMLVTAMVSMIPFTNRAGERAGISAEDAGWALQRQAMVAQLKVYHITNTCVLTAMGRIRRHVFIPAAYRNANNAYADAPCPIGYRQTISQPYIVAYMTEKLALKPGDKVLEIGTGSGYQAAVLAECGADVYTIEIIPELARHARVALDAEGYQRIHILTGDGYKGWPEYSPFDAIIVTCAPDEVPRTLVDQLKEGGHLVAPVGRGSQRLVILHKQRGWVEQADDLPVRFVPMVRE